jgi:hypothetical protein
MKSNYRHTGAGKWVGVIALVLAALLPSMQGAGVWATLEAIHQIENPRGVMRPGARGELGPYQFRAETWRMHTTVPFARAVERAESDLVAVKHYEWLSRGLARAGMETTPYNIALAWNGGLSATVNRRAPAAAHAYAQRAQNLAEEFAHEVSARRR